MRTPQLTTQVVGLGLDFTDVCVRLLSLRVTFSLDLEVFQAHHAGGHHSEGPLHIRRLYNLDTMIHRSALSQECNQCS